MNPQPRPFAYPTVTPLPASPVPAASIELDSDARWNQWADKGRRERAAFNEKMRVIGIVGGIALALALVLLVIAL